VLTTTAVLLMGGGAALLGALLEGSVAKAPDVLLLLCATLALGLVRAPRRA
jgi:hypothetical protein